MNFAKCDENKATHVIVIKDDRENYKMLDVTPGKIYEIIKNKESGFEGEEMLENDLGIHCPSFSCVVEVEWLKKEGN